MPAKQQSEQSTEATGEKYDGFTDAERAAMKERAQELKASARGGSRGKKAAADEQAVLAKIAEMPQPDRDLAERVHAVITASAPELAPKLWYGQPAYAKDGKIVCFYQSAEKYSTRYATLGFNDIANIDDGTMWPTAYGLTGLTEADEARIGELVRKAVS